MRALYSNNRGEMYIKEVPEPTLQGSGVVIRTLASVLGAGSEMAGVGRRRKALAGGARPRRVLREGPQLPVRRRDSAGVT